MVKLITCVIFNHPPLVDLEKTGRLDITPMGITLANPAAGMMVNNRIDFSTVITSNLYTNSPLSIGYVYA